MSVGGCWYFLEKCWKTGGKRTRCPRQPSHACMAFGCHGWSKQDVQGIRTLPWMATGAVPVRIRTAISLFVENSHLETRHQGVMFRSPRAFVESTTTLRYEPCTQFINVSQRALHIYWQFSAMSHAIHKIVSKKRCQSYFISRRSPHHGKNKNRDLWASSQSRFLFCLCAAHCSRNFQFTCLVQLLIS